MANKYSTSSSTFNEATEMAEVVAIIMCGRADLTTEDALPLAAAIYDEVAAVPWSGGALLRVAKIAAMLLATHPEMSMPNAVSLASSVYWSTHEWQA